MWKRERSSAVGRRPDLGIIGCGRVGTAMGILLTQQGWRIQWLCDCNEPRLRAAARCLPGSRLVRDCRLVPSGAAVVLVAVTDDALNTVARQLAAGRTVDRNTTVIHTSGAYGIDVLKPLRRIGARLGALHPIQTFTDVRQARQALPGSFFDATGDSAARPVMRTLVRDLGGKIVMLSEKQKVLAHVASVLACNYLSTLCWESTRTLGMAHVSSRQALAMERPLIEATLRNIFKLGPATALTGPIARGDASTITRHLAALRKHRPGLLPLYCVLGQATVDLALAKHSITPLQARQMRRMLSIKAGRR
jgi:predicted short-subunit dehydrogenase-like oxidoreductase (DUF2520 family)